MDDEETILGCGCLGLVWLVGMMLAVTISWEEGHSVLWATVHGLLGWLWIAYHFVVAQ
jgi:hypothetical protein